MAGPLCGIIVQPIAGAISDNFRSQPGCSRRKPFILAGTLATVVSMMGLAWIGETVAVFQAIASKDVYQALRLVFAFVWVYALNVSLQPLQGGIRTMLFESCPKQQQVQVASWYSIFIAIGNVCGYFLGSMSLQELGIPLISRMTQFQALCTIISTLLLATTVITCLCANEGILAVSEDRHADREDVFSVSPNHGSVITRAVRENLKCLRSLPEYIALVFQIQFFAWLGWFPVIYYQTT
jgi:solute carrier family 45, member 1/2/4